jgi:hypothetical protein
LITWPANLARLIAWSATEAIQQRFPQLAGRKPIAKKVVNEGAAPVPADNAG